MNYLKAAAVLTIYCIFLTSCSKDVKQEIKENIDTASHRLNRDVDTLINTALYADSLYEKAPVEKIDENSLLSASFRKKLNAIFDEYCDIKDELAGDDSNAVKKQAVEMEQALLSAETESASEKPGNKWRIWVSSMDIIIADLKAAKNLAGQRRVFSELGASVETLIRSFGLSSKTVYKVSCPKVKFQSNFWLTDSKNNLNPYYGKDRTNEKSQFCIEVVKAWKFD